jgi:crotonobetainyl-CoA:carnitine CoA-transferase CaiB-like acyl-CoA transferase
VRPPLSADGEPLAHRAAAPELGADTRAILRELGYDDAEIDAFERDGVVRSRG